MDNINNTPTKSVKDLNGSARISSVFVLSVLIIAVAFIGAVIAKATGNDPESNSDPVTSSVQEQSKPTPLAKLIVIKGTPRVESSTAQEFQDGFEGQLLYAGDKLRTDGESQAMLIFADKTSLNLDTESLVELSTAAGDSYQLRLASGRDWNRIPFTLSDKYNAATTDSEFTSASGSFGLKYLNVNDVEVRSVKDNLQIHPSLTHTDTPSFTLEQGSQVVIGPATLNQIKQADFANIISSFETPDEDWYKFNICLDTAMPALLHDLNGLDSYYSALKDKLTGSLDCEEILGINTQKQEPVASTPRIVLPKPVTGTAASISLVTAEISQDDQLLCNWESAGTISGYDYSVWTRDLTDTLILVKDWTATSNKSVNAGSSTDLGMVNQQPYFCKVKAYSNWGNAENMSEPVFYDLSTGSLSEELWMPNYQGQVEGIGNFQNVLFINLDVRFSIQNTDTTSIYNNMYCNDNDTWVMAETFFDADLTEQPGNTINYKNYDVSCVDAKKTANFKIQLVNKLTGKILYENTSPISLYAL